MPVPRAVEAAEVAAPAPSLAPPVATAAAQVCEAMAQLAVLGAAVLPEWQLPKDAGGAPLAPASSRPGDAAAPVPCGGGLVLLQAEGRMVLAEDLRREEARPVSTSCGGTTTCW